MNEIVEEKQPPLIHDYNATFFKKNSSYLIFCFEVQNLIEYSMYRT